MDRAEDFYEETLGGLHRIDRLVKADEYDMYPTGKRASEKSEQIKI